MATVIDRLVVELGLDPKAFTKGQKEAAAALLKARKEAEKEAKAIEKAMDDAGASFERLARNALKLFALLTAGRSIGQFVRDVTGADAALGRLATSIGRTPELISAMSKAVERSGGDAQAAARSFQSWSEQVEQIRTTGDSSILPFLARLQAAGGKTIDLNKRNVDGLADLADNLKAVAEQQGIASATYYGKNLGFDEGTIALMVKGGAALRNAIRESEKLGIATGKDTAAAQELQTAYRTLTQEVESFGRTILTAVSPVLVQLLKDIQAIVRAIKEWVQSNVVPFLKEFADSMGIAGSETKTLVRITEALFALWLGSKAIAFLRVLGTMRLLLTGGRVAGAATAATSGGLLGGILGLGAAGSLAASQGIATGPTGARSWHEGIVRTLDPGLANRIYGPRAGGGGPTLMGRASGAVRRMLGLGGGTAEGGGAAPAGSSAGNLTTLIDEEARRAGIDPRIMHGIRAGESGHRQNGSNPRAAYDHNPGNAGVPEDSWGPFQLNRLRGLGQEFERETGLDLSDPRTIAAQARWVANHIAKRQRRNPNYNPGSEWMGYRGLMQSNPRWGDSGYVPEAGAAGDPSGLRVSGPQATAGGRSHAGTVAAAAWAQGNLEGFRAVTALNDRFHQGRRSRHPAGLAADFGFDRNVSPQQYAANAERLRQHLRASGLTERDFHVIDERNNPSPGATGPHIHVQFNSAAAAAAYARSRQREQQPAGGATPGRTSWWRGSPNAMASVSQARDAQAAQAARVSNDNRSSSSIRNNATINGGVHVHTAATDANGITRDMEDALKRRSLAAAANYGQA